MMEAHVALRFLRSSILVPLLLVSARATAAQTIDVAPSVLVARGSAEHPLTEPYLAVDPANPNRMLAVA